MALALWQRTWDCALVKRLDLLTAIELPQVSFIARPDEPLIRIKRALDQSDLHDEAVLEALAVDMQGLISRFASITGSQKIDVRLEFATLSDDQCLHTDETKARLVTTYIGPRAIGVPTGHVWRQNKYQGPHCQFSRFAVGLLKPSHVRLRYRSQLQADDRRLFLCLNTAHTTNAPRC